MNIKVLRCRMCLLRKWTWTDSIVKPCLVLNQSKCTINWCWLCSHIQVDNNLQDCKLNVNPCFLVPKRTIIFLGFFFFFFPIFSSFCSTEVFPQILYLNIYGLLIPAIPQDHVSFSKAKAVPHPLICLWLKLLPAQISLTVQNFWKPTHAVA